jgi:aminoglycoside phosphotransferase (APT) family kinase protein
LLDRTGELLGTPGIVTSYLPGRQIHAPEDPLAWAQALGEMLAQIHAVPVDPAGADFLMDADLEAAWFLRYETVPPFMAAHPLGPEVWHAIKAHRPALHVIDPTLIHLDYWPGNILWQGGAITGVIDWEEAAYGDPAIDLAYLRMNLVIDGYDEAAGALTEAYARQTGRASANLSFWEAAAAARPMIDPDDWAITAPPK